MKLFMYESYIILYVHILLLIFFNIFYYFAILVVLLVLVLPRIPRYLIRLKILLNNFIFFLYGAKLDNLDIML